MNDDEVHGDVPSGLTSKALAPTDTPATAEMVREHLSRRMCQMCDSVTEPSSLPAELDVRDVLTALAWEVARGIRRP